MNTTSLKTEHDFLVTSLPLSVTVLDSLEPESMIASGTGYIEHPWFNHATPVTEGGTLEADGRSTKVRFVAVRGMVGDWAIYHSLDSNFIPNAPHMDDPSHLDWPCSMIARMGAKLHSKTDIKKLVPCTEDALKAYRH